MGTTQVTVKNLQVVAVDVVKGLSFCGGVGGYGALIVSEEDAGKIQRGELQVAPEAWVFVNAHWTSKFNHQNRWFIDNIVPVFASLSADPRNIRLIFNFDSFKRYFLSVPPECRTACAAVAWTYGMTEEQYRNIKVRT
jgi:hypothetical protein